MPTDRQTCPQCGTENPAGQKFCGNCGTRLQAPREQRRWATVLFADVSGFTAMSERMDAEDVGELARRCVAAFSSEVTRRGGSVVREFGDEVLAVFGAPVAHEDDPERAVRAALAIRQLELPGPDGKPLSVHVGVNTGEVISTAVELGERTAPALHGDAVNTAARIRSAAAGGTVLVGEETYRATRQVVKYREGEALDAKGKEHPVAVWEALDVEAVPHARRLTGGRFVGRAAELSLLESVWQKTREQQRPHLVTVVGEPGIGKSRSCAEFERRAIESGGRVVRGRCPPYGAVAPFWPLHTAVRELLEVDADDELAAAQAALDSAVGVSLPELDASEAARLARHVGVLAGFSEAPPDADGRALQAALRRFLEAAGRKVPLVLSIDDIHWADDALLDVLEHLASRSRDTGLFVLTQTRPELLERRPGWGRGVKAFTTVYLDPLGPDEAGELLRELATRHGVEESVIERIGIDAGGNPLFAEELVAMLAERRGGEGVPSAVKALISARIDALPSQERAVLQRAAVCGRVFWLDAVRHGSDPVEDVLELLQDRDLVRALPTSRFPGQREFLFKHDFIRDVAYDMLLRTERRQVHREILDWAEQAAGESRSAYVDLLAHHAEQAEELERALEYLSLAAERTSYTSAHEVETGLLTRALAIAERIGVPRGDLLVRRGRALRKAAVWGEARESLLGALAELPTERKEARAEVLVELAMVEVWVSGMKETERIAKEGLELARAIGREDLAAGAMQQLGLVYAGQGELREGLGMFDEACKLVEGAEIDPRGAVFEGSVLHGIALYWIGRNDEAIERGRASIARGRELNDSVSVSLAIPQLGLSLVGRGKYREALETFEEGVRFAKDFEVWAPLARTLSMSAGIHLELYDVVGHRARVEEARALASAFPPMRGFSGVDLLLNYARSGDPGAAESLMDEVLEEVDKAKAWHKWLSQARLATAQAELALARGEHGGALEAADRAIEIAQRTRRAKYEALASVVRARALHELQRTKEAAETLRAGLEKARPLGDPALQLRVIATLLDVEGTDELAAEGRRLVDAIVSELPQGSLADAFLASDAVSTIRRGA